MATGPGLTKGRLLVATPPLEDPNFDRTVVFVLEHHEEGAIGVVLNRPSIESLDEPQDAVGGRTSRGTAAQQVPTAELAGALPGQRERTSGRGLAPLDPLLWLGPLALGRSQDLLPRRVFRTGERCGAGEEAEGSREERGGANHVG